PESSKKLRILIVDDLTSISTAIFGILQDLAKDNNVNLECVTAKNGSQAIRAMGKQKFDLVLTDWRMPGMGGRELVIIIKTRLRQDMRPPLVAVMSDEWQRDAAKAIGADYFIEKPIDYEDIERLFRLARDKSSSPIQQLTTIALALVNEMLKEFSSLEAIRKRIDEYLAKFCFSSRHWLYLEPEAALIGDFFDKLNIADKTERSSILNAAIGSILFLSDKPVKLLYKKSGLFILTHPKPEDLEGLVKLNQICWLESLRYNKEDIAARIEILPQNILAIKEHVGRKEVIAAVYAVRKDAGSIEELSNGQLQWENLIGNGTLSHPQGRIAFAYDISILPDYRKLGFASELFAAWACHLKSQGLEQLYTATTLQDFQVGFELEAYIAAALAGKIKDQAISFHGRVHGIKPAAEIARLGENFRTGNAGTKHHLVFFEYDLNDFSSSPLVIFDYERRLKDLLIHLGYPKNYLPALIEEFSHLFAAIKINRLKNKLDNINTAGSTEDLLDFLEEIGILIQAQNPYRLVKLLINGLSSDDIFALVNQRDIHLEAKAELFYALTGCVPIHQLHFVLLSLLGLEMNAVNAAGHSFMLHPLSKKQAVFIDFANNLFMALDLERYYRKEGANFVLKLGAEPTKNEAINPFLSKTYANIHIGNGRGLSPSVYYNSALILHKYLNQHEKAIRLLKKAVKFDPAYASAYSALADVYLDLGEYAQASGLYKKAIGLDPGSAQYQYNLGVAYMHLAEYAESILYFETAVKYDPEFAEAHFNLGAAYFQLYMINEATTHYRTAIKLNPELLVETPQELKLALQNTAASSPLTKYRKLNIVFSIGGTTIGDVSPVCNSLQYNEIYASSFNTVFITSSPIKGYNEGKRPLYKGVNLAFSIGGTKLAVGLVDKEANISYLSIINWQEYLGKEAKEARAEDILKKIVEEIKKISEIRKIRIDKIGIAIAGPVETNAGIVGYAMPCANLPFYNYPLKEKLEEGLKQFNISVPIEILNDAEAALLGEISPKGTLYPQNFGTLVVLGTGVNFAVARRGRPYYGRDSEIREVGHNIVYAQGDYIYTGFQTRGAHPKDRLGRNVVDIEDLISGPSLETFLNKRGFNLKTITEKAAKANLEAVELIRAIAAEIGKALAAFIWAYQEEDFVRNIVLAGGVAENLGKGVFERGEDVFISAVRAAALLSLNASGVEHQQAYKLTRGIKRSKLNFEREFLTFIPQENSSSSPILKDFIKQTLREAGEINLAQTAKQYAVSEEELIRVIRGLAAEIGECLDVIYPDNLMPTGIVKTRERIHKDGDWHRTDQVLAITADGEETVIQLRKDGRWDFFTSGHFAVGERARQALMREVKEEVGVDLELLRLFRVGAFFKKIGAPDLPKPGEWRGDIYYYKTNKNNKEAFCLYIYLLNAQEEEFLKGGVKTLEAQRVQFIDWLGFVKDVFTHPDKYTSVALQHLSNKDFFGMLLAADLPQQIKRKLIMVGLKNPASSPVCAPPAAFIKILNWARTRTPEEIDAIYTQAQIGLKAAVRQDRVSRYLKTVNEQLAREGRPQIKTKRPNNKKKEMDPEEKD
ncbi:MAG: ROK family protein, partial [Candidatus Omnitrophica bacterium]|nr:ROK family protein [Candidatus Omnitrophota bacterium]